MKINIKGFNVEIENILLILLGISLVIPSLRMYFANYYMCYIFIIFHEFSHMFCACIFGIKTSKLTITITGLNIILEEKNRQKIKWIIIYAAGPISNIVLAILFKDIPFVYTINIALAVINLIPIYPLDGYNLLYVLATLFKVKKLEQKIIICNNFILTILGILGLIQLFKYCNPSIILIAMYVFLQNQINYKRENLSLYQNYYKNITEN